MVRVLFYFAFLVSCALITSNTGIAYALLSGLPPIYGLYTSFVPPFLYVFFGQSPHVSMGIQCSMIVFLLYLRSIP